MTVDVTSSSSGVTTEQLRGFENRSGKTDIPVVPTYVCTTYNCMSGYVVSMREHTRPAVDCQTIESRAYGTLLCRSANVLGNEGTLRTCVCAYAALLHCLHILYVCIYERCTHMYRNR